MKMEVQKWSKEATRKKEKKGERRRICEEDDIEVG